MAGVTLDAGGLIAVDRGDRRLAASGTSDIVDAHVVICGRRAGQQVVTSDPDDLERLDPSLPLVRI
jgi:hypothetical protein